jgi:hypothetical protein
MEKGKEKMKNKIVVLTLILLSFCSLVLTVNAQTVGSGSIDSGLVGYWRLDEGSGASVFDSSGLGNTGVFSGSGNTWVIGHYNSGINFNGSGSLDCGNSIVFQGLTSFSIGCWFKASTVPVSDSVTLIHKGFPTANGSISLWIDSGILKFRLRFGASQIIQLGGIVANVWYNVQAVYNGTYMRLFVNGVEVGLPLGVSGFIGDSSYALLIGQTTSYNYFFNGTIDNVRIYNRVLSTSEILTLYQGVPVTVSYDVGSTMSPNSTVLVGVDQNQTFIIGAKSGYVPSSIYLDGIIVNSQPVYSITGIQSNKTLYVTSQYIGSVASNTDYLGLILILIFTLFDLVLIAIPKIPLLNIIFGFFSGVVVVMYNSALPSPILTMLIIFIGVYTILRAIQRMTRRKK